MSKIGLISVLYKCDWVLEDFFESLAKQTFQSFVLYLVDNSPNEKTDSTLQNILLKLKTKLDVQHIKNKDNVGFCAGNNLGIRLALENQCTNIIILNNDIQILDTFFFEKLIHLSKNKIEEIIIPKILYFDTQKIWSAGGYLDKLRALGVHNGKDKQDSAEYNIPKYITFSPGCFYFMNTNVLNKIGLFDETYFVYNEDTDFMYRAMKLNIKVWYEPTLSLLHKVSSSTGGDQSEFYIYYSNRNKIYYIYKHYKSVIKYISLLYFLLARLVFYIKFNSNQRNKLVQGIRDGFKMC